MRVVLDTNVLVSAFISKHGHSADILDLLTTFEEIALVLSDEILEEFTDVLSRTEVRTRFQYTAADVTGYETAIRSIAEIVDVKSDFMVVSQDPKDDMVVNTAVDGRADYVVSGDEHLKKLRRFKGVRIVSPRVFMTVVTKRFGDLILKKDELR